MADDNKPIKYLRYAIGEIVLVVIGILIALSINNWNEGRKNNEVRSTYYIQILQDLEKDKVLMEESISWTDSFLIRVQTYKEIFKKPDLDLWEMAAGIGTVFGSGIDYNFETNTNTINTLQNTGDIKLIPTILKNKILDLNRKQLDIKDYRKTKMTLILNSAISTETLYGGAELGNRMGNQPKLIKYSMDENI